VSDNRALGAVQWGAGRHGRRPGVPAVSPEPGRPAMLNADDTVRALRDALRLSPDNLPLRQHLADCLLRLNRPDEAEEAYRRALARAPDLPAVKVGLAQAFARQGKTTQALVVVEDVLKAPSPPAAA